jgi:hypothetical protein
LLTTFHHALDDREGSDRDFYRLARMIDESGFTLVMEITPPPPEFETSVPAIQELSEWMIQKVRQVRRLGGTPCQTQRIASIQAGMTLHLRRANVKAVVVVVEDQQQQQQLAKRKRFRPNKRQRPSGCYATLGDDTGSIVFFLEQQHRFASMISTLQLAYGNRQDVEISHSKAIRTTDDEILLIPTNRSVVSIIEQLDEPPFHSEQSRSAFPQDEENVLRCVLEKKRQEQVTCTIRDIVVQGVSLLCYKHVYLLDGSDSNAEKLHSLLRMDDLSYQDIHLDLEEVTTGKKYVSVANTSVVEKLLGDTTIDAWKSNTNLQRIVVQLVRGLLEDNIPLTWTMEHRFSRESEPLQQSFIVDVNLGLFC